MKKYLFLTFIFIMLFSCKSFLERTAVKIDHNNYIRVVLTLGNEIAIKNNSNIVIKDFKSNQAISLKNNPDKIVFKVNEDKTFMNNEELTSAVAIYDKNGQLLTLNENTYFGTLKIIPGKTLTIINYLPIDLYLLSVLPSEVPVSFSNEALKAQAVIARTYAYLFIKKYWNKREFDVDDTTRYQVYKGYNIWLRNDDVVKLRKAIDDTYHLIITYKNEPILAYFHSNSGGKIISGKEYFGDHSDYPYLPAKDDPYSLNYPGSSWKLEMKYDELKIKLNFTEDLTKENVIYNENGFLEKINLKDKIITPREIRRVFGYNAVKSEKLTIVIDKDENKAVISGAGFGHGVGMSQWGAQGMALLGKSFKEIISFYYPNTELSYIKDENENF